MSKTAILLWVDLEMTGLDFERDTILEVAAIATDWNFKELATYEAVIHQSDEVLANMNEWCVTQHGASGLTDKSRASSTSLKQAEDQLLEFIDDNFKAKESVLLAGNSIHIDRVFIRKYWPLLDAKLHYRMLDVSAWKVVFEGKFRGQKFIKPEDHRALNDIRGSISELETYLKRVKQQ